MRGCHRVVPPEWRSRSKVESRSPKGLIPLGAFGVEKPPTAEKPDSTGANIVNITPSKEWKGLINFEFPETRGGMLGVSVTGFSLSTLHHTLRYAALFSSGGRSVWSARGSARHAAPSSHAPLSTKSNPPLPRCPPRHRLAAPPHVAPTSSASDLAASAPRCCPHTAKNSPWS